MDEELRDYARTPEDAERLSATLTALRSLPDEEIPRRIAFVSDKVFEPKWWQRFPAWGFASAAVLAGAIVAHGYVQRPEAAPAPQPVAQVDTSVLERKFEALLRQADAEHDAKLRAVVAATEKRLEFEHRAQMLTIEENFNLMRKQLNRFIVATAEVR
jgi:primosomal protein N''